MGEEGKQSFRHNITITILGIIRVLSFIYKHGVSEI
jgi:hypothetical protein